MQDLIIPEFLLQVRGLTQGRAAALVPMALGLIGLVSGCLAIARSAGINGSRKLKSVVALVAALASIVLAARHLARATGDIGSGSGKLGAIVAIVLALTGMVLGGLALVRSRRTLSS